MEAQATTRLKERCRERARSFLLESETSESFEALCALLLVIDLLFAKRISAAEQEAVLMAACRAFPATSPDTLRRALFDAPYWG